MGSIYFETPCRNTEGPQLTVQGCGVDYQQVGGGGGGGAGERGHCLKQKGQEQGGKLGQTFKNTSLTPSLPQTVKFPG